MKYIKKFNKVSLQDITSVGGKNASIGEMIAQLSGTDIIIPQGFATTADSYWFFLKSNNIMPAIQELIVNIKDYQDVASLQKTSNDIRSRIEAAEIPSELQAEISEAYTALSQEYNQPDCAVAVRSSATAEDLPTASFAGQQESFLNVNGIDDVLNTYKKCISSLFTARAIAYRHEQKFDHMAVALSVGIQKMVNAQSAGVAFTLDPESGFKDVVTINSNWGLGETVVKGEVTPDSFYVYKPTLIKNQNALLRKLMGNKNKKLIFDAQTTKLVPTDAQEQAHFSLSDSNISILAKQCLVIEKHYSDLNGKWTPMDIEWALDAEDKKLYIVQARPETIHSQKNALDSFLVRYSLKENQSLEPIITGQSIGQAIVSGKARVINSVDQIGTLKAREILVTRMTDPDWVPIMKIAAGIVTDVGGRTCHAAIVSRELGIPAIIGTQHGTQQIQDGEMVTLDCSQGQKGTIYKGTLEYETYKLELNKLNKPQASLLLNMSDPSNAFTYSFLPADGIGLARIEFIFANSLKIHPMALLFPEKVTDESDKQLIKDTVQGYPSNTDYFIDILAQEVGTIAAAFAPRPVTIRFSDLKSNEYRNLIAGHYFEPKEENPMLGLRGAARYYSPLYEPAFRLECKAIHKVINDMGLTNVTLLVPFVRTTQEATRVLSILKEEKLASGKDLKIYMMCEIPSNVLLIQEFAKQFDGFSIGSNDLTQFTLAVDRDSALVASIFDERDLAVTVMLQLAISGAHQAKRPIGICGEAPSDFPEIRTLLLKQKIDSISLNPESLIRFLLESV